jgi:AraC-like DNA-binding protein
MNSGNLTIDLWSVLFLVAACQAIFVAVVILLKKERSRPAIFFSAFMLLFAYMLIFNFFYWTGLLQIYPFLSITNFPVNLAFGPLLLLYLDAQRNKPMLQKWWWVHFFPTILMFIHFLPFYILKSSEKIAIWQGKASFPNFLLFDFFTNFRDYRFFGPLMIIYVIWMIWLLRKMRAEENSDDQELHFEYRWTSIIITMYTLFVLSYLSYFIFSTSANFEIYHDYIISAIMTLTVYVIAYLVFQRPQIIHGQIHPKIFSKPKYLTSSLTTQAIDSIDKSVLSYFEQHKPYHDGQLKLKDLSDQLNISPHHLSQVINERFDAPFNQFVNDYRIRDAKTLLRDPERSKEPIIQIAYQVGFNNKSTFNAAFKKSTGLTPSEYRVQRNVLQNSKHL